MNHVRRVRRVSRAHPASSVRGIPKAGRVRHASSVGNHRSTPMLHSRPSRLPSPESSVQPMPPRRRSKEAKELVVVAIVAVGVNAVIVLNAASNTQANPLLKMRAR